MARTILRYKKKHTIKVSCSWFCLSFQEGNIVAWNFENDETSILVSKDLFKEIHSKTKPETKAGKSTILVAM